MITEAAPAKVNLYLHVIGRTGGEVAPSPALGRGRDGVGASSPCAPPAYPPGYHLLDSLAVFASAADLLTAAPADRLTLTLGGPFGTTLAAEPDNLVLRAARALAAAAGVPAHAALHLEKHLPVAAGIGGGSADAAAALRALNRLWGLGWSTAELAMVAAPLGADVPVCVASRPARMQGIGDLLAAAPALPACGLLLVNPGAALATPAVFRARTGAFSPPAELPPAWPDAAAMACDLAGLRNDLEAPAISLCPPVAEVLATLRALPGCLLARMSGSGATCFGIFATPAVAVGAGEALPPAWWRHGGGLYAATC